MVFSLILTKKSDAKKDTKDKPRAPPLAFGIITSRPRTATMKKTTVTKKLSTNSVDSPNS